MDSDDPTESAVIRHSWMAKGMGQEMRSRSV